jgi:hypothetical protein
VETSNNGVDFTADCVPFSYYTEAVVESLSPNHGPRSGGTNVTINGKHFVGEEVFCKFGGIAIVKASVLSTTRIVCESPQDLSSGYNNVEVSLNGADYTPTGFNFLSLRFLK